MIPALSSKQGCHSYSRSKGFKARTWQKLIEDSKLSWAEIAPFRVQRLCQNEDNVRGSNKDTNIG